MKFMIARSFAAAALLSFGASLLAAETKTPTVSAVLDRYIEKLGGQAALDKIKSRSIKGEFIAMENPVAYVDQTQEGKKRFWSIEIPNASPMVRVTDGDKGWSKAPDGSVTELEAGELARLKQEAAFRLRMNPKGVFDLAYDKSEKQGEDTLHILKASTPGGNTDWLYFSEKTGLLVRFRSEWDSGSNSFDEQLEDYRALDGVQYSFTRKARFNDFEFTLKFKEVKVNEAIDPAAFAKPKTE